MSRFCDTHLNESSRTVLCHTTRHLISSEYGAFLLGSADDMITRASMDDGTELYGHKHRDGNVQAQRKSSADKDTDESKSIQIRLSYNMVYRSYVPYLHAWTRGPVSSGVENVHSRGSNLLAHYLGIVPISTCTNQRREHVSLTLQNS